MWRVYCLAFYRVPALGTVCAIRWQLPFLCRPGERLTSPTSCWRAKSARVFTPSSAFCCRPALSSASSICILLVSAASIYAAACRAVGVIRSGSLRLHENAVRCMWRGHINRRSSTWHHHGTGVTEHHPLGGGGVWATDSQKCPSVPIPAWRASLHTACTCALTWPSLRSVLTLIPFSSRRAWRDLISSARRPRQRRHQGLGYLISKEHGQPVVSFQRNLEANCLINLKRTN